VKALEAIDVISAVTGIPQRRLVAILQRDDGHFSFSEEYFCISEDEGGTIA
jgi:hypothetical protein